MKSTIHARWHGSRSRRSTLDLGGEGEAEKLFVPRWYFISQKPDPYFDHVLEPFHEGTRALQSSPSRLGGVRVQPDSENWLRWKTDTNLFHRVVGCGPVVEFTMQARNQAAGHR